MGSSASEPAPPTMNNLDHSQVDEHIPGTEVMRDHDGIVLQRAHDGAGQV